MLLNKTLESPLDCKEIQPVHFKGDQSWVFFGRNDAKAETPLLWSLPGASILHIECILSAALSTASPFRIWNSSTGILSLLGASVRNSTLDKGHEEGGSAYAKAGSSLRGPPGNFRAFTPKTRVCLLSALCFHLHL